MKKTCIRCPRCRAGIEDIKFSILYVDYRGWYRYDAICQNCGQVWMHKRSNKIETEYESKPEKVIFT